MILNSIPHFSGNNDKKEFKSAAKRGDLGKIQEMINDQKVDSNDCGKSLVRASKAGHRDIVKFLLGLPNINPNKKVGSILSKKSAMQASVANGDLATTLMLKLKGATSKKAPKIALKNGHSQLQEVLLQLGQGSSIAAIAVAKDNAQTVRDVLDLGADASGSDHDFRRPIGIAATQGDLDKLELLLQHQAPPNQPDKDGKTAIHNVLASELPQARKEAVIRRLVADGGNINQADNAGQTPILQAIQTQDTDSVNLLTQMNADMNIKNHKNDTTMSLIKNMPGTPVAETVQKYFGQFNLVSFNTRDLHNAISNQNEKEISHFLESPIDINGKNAFGDTVLISSIIHDKSPEQLITRKILLKQPDVNLKGQDSKRALHWAIATDKIHALRQILTIPNLDINCSDEDGVTPIMLAAASGNTRLVKRLKDRGADIHATDNNGNTAAEYARERNHAALAQLLTDEVQQTENPFSKAYDSDSSEVSSDEASVKESITQTEPVQIRRAQLKTATAS